jgi:superfamily I DNA and RNA helicase
MDLLTEEWRQLVQNDYKLKFICPTAEEKKQLRVINRDLYGSGRARRRSVKMQREQLLQAVQRGEIDPDQLILELQNLKK